VSSIRSTLLRITLALGLAFALWAFVSFSQNPEELVSFPDVPLQVVGVSAGLVLVDTNGLPSPALPSVDIQLRTDRAQQNVLRPVDVRAVLDLTGLGPGEHSVPVNVQPTRSNLLFSVPESGVEPASVVVRLEEMVTREVPIALQISGNLPFSFERGDPAITSAGEAIAQVQVTGPQSRAERVVEAQAPVNIEQLRANYLAPLSLDPVDAAGRTVEGVEILPAQVTVLIPIRSVVGLKLVPVGPQIVGQPGAGYEVTAVEVEPPLVSLTGGSGPLDEADVIGTEPVDIGGIVATLVRDVALIFPPGTAGGEGEPSSVRVTVRVAPIARPFQVQLPAQVTLTGLGGGLLVSANPAVVTLTVAGSTTALDALAATTLRAAVDVAGLGPGSYSLPVSADLPDGVALVGDPPVVVVTLRAPPTALPTAAPAATPAATTAATTAATPTVAEEVAPTPTAEPTAERSATPETPTP
jgi:YbbR domain-containing protein